MALDHHCESCHGPKSRAPGQREQRPGTAACEEHCSSRCDQIIRRDWVDLAALAPRLHFNPPPGLKPTLACRGSTSPLPVIWPFPTALPRGAPGPLPDRSSARVWPLQRAGCGGVHACTPGKAAPPLRHPGGGGMHWPHQARLRVWRWRSIPYCVQGTAQASKCGGAAPPLLPLHSSSQGAHHLALSN